jgi:PilZ domain
MSTSPNLKLVDHDRPNADTILLERREAPRHRVHGQVTAILHRTSDGGAHHQICSVELRNISDIGVGAFADRPLDLGTDITVVFPSHGPDRGFDLFGHVVRCRPSGEGYELGIELSQRTGDRCVA